ncbi:MAG: ribosomal L7Ae/L30e/S12e/Gadd45 family protein [Syntrophomonadaceae bacterium]|nr:ribosomal L7Ae/L30e/S12e/Gadd45 family protein [Syntrophomonadaceae bacterium]MDD3022932.1 ribosomal L7Ae/L30e/S12e/Gadd45 family protein [Syntrophomonadaceae bacterium]
MKNVYSMIGFAQKAGKASSGAQAAKTSLLRRRAYLLIISNDIAENTKSSLLASCEKQKIPWLVLSDKYSLGTCVGKAYRVAVTINDSGMAQTIIEAVKSKGEELKTMGVVEWPK